MNIVFHVCPRCKKLECAYRKTYYESEYKVDSPNIFYVCENPDCCFFIKIDTSKKVYLQWDDCTFEWIKIYDSTLPRL